MTQQPAPSPTRRSQTLRQILSDPESFATTLLTILVDTYVDDDTPLQEVLSWSPQTVAMELEESFQAQIPQNNIDKIAAAASLLTTDDFFHNLPQFVRLCNVLADDEFDPLIFDMADAAEMAWAITEALLIRPPDDGEEAIFSDDIRRYIAYVLTNEGILTPPDVLQLALFDQDRPDPLALESDDPVMYDAIFQHQQTKSQEITEMLRQQIQQLFAQLDALPLSRGSTQGLLQRMQNLTN